MKKQILFALLAATSLVYSCKKDDNKSEPYKCATCTTSPDAKAAYDNSSAGVYKGVLVGSSGTIALYLMNGDSVVKALVAFDGKSAILTTNDLSNWNPGEAISVAQFTGVIDGQNISAIFSVDANGQNPNVLVNIPGHNVTVGLYKETSTALVRNFEGTYKGDDEGIFNMTVHGNDYTLVLEDDEVLELSLVNGKVEIIDGGTVVKGEFQGTDLIKGTWKNDDGEQGTWEAKRTL